MSGTDSDGWGLLSHDRFNQPLDTSTSLAATAVLLALACSDHDLAKAEAAAIVQFCAKAFSLTAAQRQDLLRAAKHIIEDPDNLADACHLLRVDLSTSQRRAIARQLEAIMQADGKITDEERQLHRRILTQLDLVAPSSR